MGTGFTPTCLCQVSPHPLLHRNTLTIVHGSAEGNIPDDLSSAAQWQGQFDNYFN